MNQLINMLNNFKYSAKRLESLPIYKIENSEWEEYQRYIEGIPEYYFEPSNWYKNVKSHTDSGGVVERIRVIPEKLNTYIAFEFETGYVPHSLAGETILTIDNKTYLETPLTTAKMGDFWIFDESNVLFLEYDEEGRFIKSELITNTKTVQIYIDYYEKIKKYTKNFNSTLKLIRTRKF